MSKKDFQQIFWLVSEAKKFVISERDLLQKELETKILGKKLEDVEINDLKEMGIKIPGPEDIAIPR